MDSDVKSFGFARTGTATMIVRMDEKIRPGLHDGVGMRKKVESERDDMIMEILSSSIQAGLRDLNLSAAISAPGLIGEDRVGLIIYQEGRIPLFWDSPIAEMYPTFPHQYITRLCFLVPGHP